MLNANLLRAAVLALMVGIGDRPLVLQDGQAAKVTASVGACLVPPGQDIEIATEADMSPLPIVKRQLL